MVIDRTNDTTHDIKLEHGVRRMLELKAEKKKGRVTFYLDHGKVSELEFVIKE